MCRIYLDVADGVIHDKINFQQYVEYVNVTMYQKLAKVKDSYQDLIQIDCKGRSTN